MKTSLTQADCLEWLRSLPDESVHCCITSPPYYGLRDYGASGQIGLEKTPALYISRLVAVFEEVKRVLRKDGTLWLNIGDSYNAHPGQRKTTDKVGPKQETNGGSNTTGSRHVDGIKPKDLLGIPWLLAFALRDSGWYLRSEIIWAKPNPMPESVTDRPTKAHEQLFLLAKSQTYYYDAEAIAEKAAGVSGGASFGKQNQDSNGTLAQSRQYDRPDYANRNRRSVWSIATEPYPGAHFAVFPTKLIEPCVLAGSPAGGTIIDPFMGSGTTGVVAKANGRNFMGCDLNPKYVEMAKRRLEGVTPVMEIMA